jgi:hypothetical protein
MNSDDLTIAWSDAKELLCNAVTAKLELSEAVATKKQLREIGSDLTGNELARYQAWRVKADAAVDSAVTDAQLEKLRVVQANGQDETQICPICHGEAVSWCKCRIHSCTCDNGHTWYDKDGHTYLGNGHHGPGRRVVRDLSLPIAPEHNKRVDYEPRDLNPGYGDHTFSTGLQIGKTTHYGRVGRHGAHASEQIGARVRLEQTEFVKLQSVIDRMESENPDQDDAPYRMLLWLLCISHAGADTTSALLKHRITYLVHDPHAGLGSVESLIDPFVKLHYHALHTGKHDVLLASDKSDPVLVFKQAITADLTLAKFLNRQIEKFGEDTLVQNYNFFGEDL